MFLRSDNMAGVHPEILAAMAACNGGNVAPYGGDPWTAELEARMAEVFGAPLRVFCVPSGTAANALALASLAGPFDLIACHTAAHAFGNECGATEAFSGGARFLPIGGADGRIDLAAARAALDARVDGRHDDYRLRALTLTELTEAGTAYSAYAMRALGDLAHEHGLAVHVDGARLPNALAATGAHPADLTWRAGVDVLSFGGTKNGTMGADAVVFFDLACAEDFERRQKRGGHALSKTRFLSVQLLRYLEGGLWLDNARHANAQAARLAEVLRATPGVSLLHPVDGNIVFAAFAPDVLTKLERGGIALRLKGARADGTQAARLVTSFATQPGEIDAFAAALEGRPVRS